MIQFKIGDRVTVARSFGVYEAGECGTVVGQLRPYIHVALDNPHQPFGAQHAQKAATTLFQSDEIVAEDHTLNAAGWCRDTAAR